MASDRLVAVGLTGLYVVVGLELFFYRSIAARLLEAAGAPGSLGPEYLLVLATRLIPGALLFLILATVVVFRARKRPRGPLFALAAVWVCQFLLLAVSIEWYARWAAP